MLVRDIMSSPVVSVPGGATLEEACLLMRERGIRHLPVLEGGRLAGVVTDRDVHGATSILCTRPAGMQSLVRGAMTRPARTAVPHDPVEEAARTMRGLKIGCLPVVEDDDVVGIVTGLDLLDALLRLTGVTSPSTRLEVALPPGPGELTRLTTLLNERCVGVRSVLTCPAEGTGTRTVLRVDAPDSRPLARLLRSAGFAVLWPPDRPWSA